MPFPPPPRALSGPRRRALLATAAGTALLMSCSGPGDSGEEGPGGSPSAAERARARAARDSAALAARYDAVLAAHPRLAARLTPLRAEVVRHTEAFGGAATASGAPGTSGATGAPGPTPSKPTVSGAASSGAASASPSGASASGAAAGGRSAPPASPAVPANEKDALAALAAAERTLADDRVAALAGLPGELARLLASVAAAGAAHAYLLTEGTR
ncbi:hypothetical protein [Streptomyces sp. NPDC101166]|uniref:hypothetical protein n=1 Tax=Streptomyces sp. NPDC101166 TaxID=3366120 RepID=UPI003805BC9A